MIHLLGWIGTFLVLASYAQTSTARLRQINLVASVALAVFNAWLGIWSNVALEVAVAAINIYRLFVRPTAGTSVWRPRNRPGC